MCIRDRCARKTKTANCPSSRCPRSSPSEATRTCKSNGSIEPRPRLCRDQSPRKRPSSLTAGAAFKAFGMRRLAVWAARRFSDTGDRSLLDQHCGKARGHGFLLHHAAGDADRQAAERRHTARSRGKRRATKRHQGDVAARHAEAGCRSGRRRANGVETDHGESIPHRGRQTNAETNTKAMRELT